MDDLFGDLAGLGIKKPQSEDIFKEDEQEAAARPGVQSPIEKRKRYLTKLITYLIRIWNVLCADVRSRLRR